MSRERKSMLSANRRRGIVAAVCAIASALAVAACGGSSGGSSTPAQTNNSATPGSGAKLVYTTPPASGHLSSITWDLPDGEPSTVDPAKSGDFSPDLMASNICDNLFRLQPHGQVTPGIAQSYRFTDPRTLVLDIRKGVKFWDGHPLTAADVAYSLQRTASAKSGSIYVDFFSTVKSIEQTGPYQVTVHFKTPDELLVKEMSTALGGVVEKAYAEKVGDQALGSPKGKIMCSGPYELKSWSPGQQIVLTKNPHYWDPHYTPKINTIVVKFLSDTSSVTSALTSGEIDGAYGVSPESLPALKSSQAGKLYLGPSLRVVYLHPTGLGPLTNPKVRLALSMVIDRNAIAQKIYDGAAVPARALAPISTWTPSSATSIYQRGYDALPGQTTDVAAAKKLLAGVSGLSKPIVVGILGGDQTSIDLATLVQQEAAQIGLHIVIRQLAPVDYSNITYVKSYRKGIDASLGNSFLDIPDQLDLGIYFVYPYPTSTFNFIGYDNQAVRNDVTKARETLNPIKRAKYLVQAQAGYMGKASVIIPVVYPDQSLFLNNKLGGATTSYGYLFEPSFALLGGK